MIQINKKPLSERPCAPKPQGVNKTTKCTICDIMKARREKAIRERDRKEAENKINDAIKYAKYKDFEVRGTWTDEYGGEQSIEFVNSSDRIVVSNKRASGGIDDSKE